MEEAEEKWDRWYKDPPYFGCFPYINAANWRAFDIEQAEERIEEMAEAFRRAK